MIIAFYPGAGGNRLYHYLNGQREFSDQTTYDHLLQNQSFAYRYLDKNSVGLADQELILTHCMNVPLIQQHFPQQKNIVVIVGNLTQCLKREWTLAEQFRDKDLNGVEHARASLDYHTRYYTEYPVDITGATTVIDLEDNNHEFAQIMKKELDSINSPVFDQAVSTHKSHSLDNVPGDKIVDGFKSKFLSDAEIMQQRLDEVSPSLCLAKWKQVSLHLTTGLNNSCYHPPLHVIPVESIQRNPSALHNTDHKKQQRQLMLNGIRPDECGYCWAMEDNGKLSDRHYRSGEPWAAKDFGRIASADWNEDFIPSYVEVNFNHVCNLQCSYCSPQFSSSWMDEVEREGGYPTTTTHNDPNHFVGNRRPIPVREHNPYVEAFWQWWPELYPELEHFRMTGGEPLLDKNTYRVFDYVLSNPKPNLHLNVTSNFSVDNKSWNKYLDYVKRLCHGENIEHFMQYVSLDAWGSQAEYIRHGLDFDLLWSRVNQFLTEIPGRNSVTFIVTMNNLSVTSLQKLFQGILDLRKQHSTDYQRVWFDTPVLRQPDWQSLQILPESYVQILNNLHVWMSQQIETAHTRFQGFKDYEIARLDRDIAWMKDGQKLSTVELNRRKADFYRFFAEHDRRRGTDFLKTFPEMTAWWKECEYHARTS